MLDKPRERFTVPGLSCDNHTLIRDHSWRGLNTNTDGDP
ncbi:hypothetical protein TRICHSKD4_5584 [Roseibium sp. TrichSKD4]|nr:hypothetical protein TRICHSKD4_5584 [Roseibium sp. TrichSKD4]